MKYPIALLCLLLTPVVALSQVEVTLEAFDDTAAEAGQDAGVLRFSRSNSTGNLTVNVGIDGSSTATPNDFSSSDGGTLGVFGTVSFPAGQATVDITLTPTLDNLVEGQEQFDVSLESGSGYTIGLLSSASILFEDDPPVVTLETADGDANEAGQDPFVFRARRTGGNINQALTVNVTIDPGNSADINNDFSGDDGGTLQVFKRLAIPGGSAVHEITFTPVLDNRVEAAETFAIALAGGSYVASVAPNTASATIADDPPVVTLETADGDANEAGQDPFVFRARRTGGNINQALTVNVTIDPGNSADINNDFSGDDGGTLQVFKRLAIPGGSTVHEITFTPVLDNRVEAAETFAIALAGGSYVASVAPNTGSATIADDPPVVTLTAPTPTAVEGFSPGVLRFARTGGNPNQILTVNASFADTSGATTSDFSADDGGTLVVFGRTTIGVGNTSRQITLTAVEDQLDEDEEELTVLLDPGSYLVGDPDSATILFLDNPPPLFKDGFEGK